MTCFSPRPVPDPRRARPTTRPLTDSFATRFARNTYYAALNEGDFKKMGRPWEVGKAFENSAPLSPIVPAAKTGHPTEGSITLKVNGVLRQKGDLNQLIWKIPEMISYLSDYFELKPGDIIMTGTPAGVGPVVGGHVMEGHVDGVGSLTVTVV